jgi:hypothetical protein
MTGPTEQEIRTRAYELWKAAGEPQGQMDVLWYQAEKELLARRPANGKTANGETANGEAANGEARPEMNGHHKPASLQ